MHLFTQINRCNAFLRYFILRFLLQYMNLDGFWLRWPSLKEVSLFVIKKKKKKKGKYQNVLVECGGQTKQKTGKFTVHRCTQVQFESRNWSQGVMAGCISWLSGGYLLQTRTNHYIMQRREYFLESTVRYSLLGCVCVCFTAGDPVCSHGPDTCRWTQNSRVSADTIYIFSEFSPSIQFFGDCK